MQIVNIHQAKTHFSKLIDLVAHGEEIQIAKAGKPVAKLVSLEPTKIQRHFGVLKGKITISNDFDAPLPDNILDDFEGK